nr:MAG TPA: hypothetical protein [Bacteriophage sp.]
MILKFIMLLMKIVIILNLEILYLHQVYIQ